MKRHPCLIGSALVLTACATGPVGPQLHVADRLVWSEPPSLVATGLSPGASYGLVTERRSFWDADATERSRLSYRADASGRLDTSRAVPDGETSASVYEPIRAMAYFNDEVLDDLGMGEMRFRLLDAAGNPVLERTVGLGPDPDGLVETTLGPDFPGAYLLRRRDAGGAQPAIVVLGGSEGGDRGSRATAPALAAEGYAALGLPYYSPAWFGATPQFPELRRAFAELPVDYLERAVAMLRQQPGVDPDRILLWGGSKGAEYALLAGSLIPDDSAGGGFCAIVADVPTDVVWEGWGPGTTPGETSGFSWRGEALPFVPYEEMGRALDRSDPYTMTQAHEEGRAANPDRVAAARIRVEAIDEPVLVIGGGQDTTWASGRMARAIERQRDSAGLETESYLYPEGGHGVGGTPLVRTSPANLAARLESFPASLDFVRRHARRDDCRT
ncbi:acyl-CoA thioester hydrolase/BAAT C-terminal domain-containing protein [uncultured Algimonas sp.]|uniref:alpha/beta hydrolase family protein n=1 Tax=uncultured Algimonas sp. TaxID=1547920 RepID=UPI002638714B|nr:acyl-CoA thioester hydrolase/BAAT C-terminal domain-containing protein [uncultured Algimonas sp.]